MLRKMNVHGSAKESKMATSISLKENGCETFIMSTV